MKKKKHLCYTIFCTNLRRIQSMKKKIMKKMVYCAEITCRPTMCLNIRACLEVCRKNSKLPASIYQTSVSTRRELLCYGCMSLKYLQICITSTIPVFVGVTIKCTWLCFSQLFFYRGLKWGIMESLCPTVSKRKRK